MSWPNYVSLRKKPGHELHEFKSQGCGRVFQGTRGSFYQLRNSCNPCNPWQVVCLVLVLLLSLTGEGRAGDQPGWEEMQADLRRKVSLEVEAAKRMAAADRYYRKGLALAAQGRGSEAGTAFKRAEQTILDAGEEIYYESSLGKYFHELRSRIPVRAVSAFSDDRILTQQYPEPLVDRRTRAWLTSALRRSVTVEPRLRSIFRNEGVPEELIYVGLVESGYRADAVSSAGAVGPWQFMPETARRYGLRQWKDVDERRELEKSTRAAARYLRDLYEFLGDWTLAIAGYNAGEYRVLRAMQESGGKDFWSLRHLLPSETAEYVPRVLAAIQMARSSS